MNEGGRLEDVAPDHVDRPEPPLVVALYPAGSFVDNPYYAQLSAAVERHGVRTVRPSLLRLLLRPPAAVHVHWPEFALWLRWTPLILAEAARFSLLLRLARTRDIPVVWTIHNVRPHQFDGRTGHRLYASTARSADLVVCLSTASLERARAVWPTIADTPAIVTPHGRYDVPAPPARRLDGVASLLFFGRIRPYKGVEDLMTVFSGWPADARLTVAGKPLDGSTEASLRRLASQDPRIDLRLGYVPDAEVAQLFGTADLVVLPFNDVLNSGSALLALSHDRPVLLPDVPQFRELREQVGPDNVLLYDSPLEDADLERALESARRSGRPAPDLRDHEWDPIGAATAAAYRAARG